MSLILCRQTADVPFCHDKLNINLKSEQELCYVIYNYPLLCLDGFCSERLYAWIESQLGRADLKDKLIKSERMGESTENRLLIILRECNYYGAGEITELRKRLAELEGLRKSELTYREGLALFKAGNYKKALDKLEQSKEELESEFKGLPRHDDRELRALNERKSELYCDMAALKLQMFDERSAIELLELSKAACMNDRAVRMRYLIDESGELPEDERTELDNKKDEARKKARESESYKKVLDIFNQDTPEILKEAGRLAAEWKRSCRRM